MYFYSLARFCWSQFVYGSSAIIFVVDASNRDRIPEAKAELQQLLSDKRINMVPFLILGNKIDQRGALTEMELKNELGISLSTTGKQASVPKGIRPMEVFMCSIIFSRGYKEAMRWLVQVF